MLIIMKDMKNKYIKPEIEVIEIEPITMLAISEGGGLNVKGNEEIDYDNGGSELSNRRRNYWKEVGGGW